MGSMADAQPDDLSDGLLFAVRGFMPGASIRDLPRLAGGASHQTWAFEAISSDKSERLILRLAGAWGGDNPGTVGLTSEAALIERVPDAGVPVPAVRYVLTPDDGLGEGYIMAHIEGETVAQRILNKPEFECARGRLAPQCGDVLARIHSVPLAPIGFLRTASAQDEVHRYYEDYRNQGQARPVFELAFRWLKNHIPPARDTALVHGDFRNGNLMVGADGLRAVLDWEMAHIGDPMADLGWLCVNSWRFGHIDRPVGGFGSREDLFASYEARSGCAVDRDAVAFWEIYGTLKWGMICQAMALAFKSGSDTSVERAAIGRRASETEIDLLRLLSAG